MDEIDWSVTTWEGNRRLQHLEFLRLSLREKLECIEQMAEVASRLQGGALRKRGLASEPSPDESAP